MDTRNEVLEHLSSLKQFVIKYWIQKIVFSRESEGVYRITLRNERNSFKWKRYLLANKIRKYKWNLESEIMKDIIIDYLDNYDIDSIGSTN